MIGTAALVLGTSVAVLGAVATGGRWVLRAVIREDVKPLEDVVESLTRSVDGLASEMRESKTEAEADRKVLSASTEAIQQMLQSHERRISNLEVKAARTRRASA